MDAANPPSSDRPAPVATPRVCAETSPHSGGHGPVCPEPAERVDAALSAADQGQVSSLCRGVDLAQRPIRTEWLGGRSLLATAATICLVYLLGVTGQWWPTPDSALYLGLARSLATDQGYRFNEQPHNLVAPGLPLLLAGLEKLFGATFLAPNLLMCLCGLAGLYVVYRVFVRVSEPAIAWAVAVLTGGCYAYYLNAHRVLTDAPFFLLFWLTVLVCLRADGRIGWLIVAALLAVAGIVVRVPGLAALGILAIGLVIQWRSEQTGRHTPLLAATTIFSTFALTGGALLAIGWRAGHSLPAYASVFVQIRQMGATRVMQQFALAMSDLPGQTAALFLGQPVALLGWVLLTLGGIGALLLWLRGQRLWAVLWILYPLGIALLAGNGAIHARYLLPLYPAMGYAVCVGVQVVVAGIVVLAKRLAAAEALGLVIVAGFVGVSVLSNAPKVLRHAVWYSHLAGRASYAEATRNGRYADLAEVVEAIQQQVPPGGKIACLRDVNILHFLTGRPLVSYVPQQPTVQDGSWLPPDATCIVLHLPEEENTAIVCRTLKYGPEPRTSTLLAGKVYEAYHILPAPSAAPASGPATQAAAPPS
jgi:hypothetical protein